MALRRLLYAFLLSLVVSIFATSVSDAASFQSVQFGPGSPSTIRLVQHYDAGPNFSTGGGSSLDLGVAASSVSMPMLVVAWANTPLVPVVVATDAAGDALPAFTQTTAGPALGSGVFQGQAISDLANGLRSGTISPSQLPINVLDRGQGLLGFDTRSMLALRQANIPLSDWTLLDQTGVAPFEQILTQRLAANGLTEAGTDTLKITGAGPWAS